MKQVVITADDVGIAVETNAAVEIAHRQGVLTSASLMANMPAFGDAVAMTRRNPGLGTSVHLVLTSGRPVLKPDRVPLLVDRNGLFRYTCVALPRLLLGPQRSAALGQIADEFAAQIQKAQAAGLHIDHLDGHRHVHMIPAIWPIVHELADEYAGGRVRIATERPSWKRARRGRMQNFVKALVLRACAHRNQHRPAHQVHFLGLMDSGQVGDKVLRRLLRKTPDGLSEVVTHPSLAIPPRPGGAGMCCTDLDEAFIRAPGRQAELAALIHPTVRELLEERNIRAVSFREVAGTAQAAPLGWVSTA